MSKKTTNRNEQEEFLRLTLSEQIELLNNKISTGSTESISENELLFNWRCIMAKSNALDYIVVHEICHMYHKDHSKEFWDLVASVLPD